MNVSSLSVTVIFLNTNTPIINKISCNHSHDGWTSIFFCNQLSTINWKRQNFILVSETYAKYMKLLIDHTFIIIFKFV